MDIEYHYWMTGLIAHRAGFTEEETQTIAYASQFVDENDVCMEIMDKARPKEAPYTNFISQTMNILKPKDNLLRIYPIFHFIPGQPDAITARRRDGKMHLLNTTPNNENANRFIDEAFKAHEDTRLYRIGIATHCYVDTWAHQNFVGWYDNFNDIGFDPKPNIGHADAEHHPDWMSHIWIDSRLVEAEVNNKHRFLSASEHVYAKYCSYLKDLGREDRSERWEDLENELETMMGATYTGNKCKYEERRTLSYQKKLPFLKPFDEQDWLDGAIYTKVRGARDSENSIGAMMTLFKDEHYWREDVEKEQTHWYRFQEAVKEHEIFGLKVLTPTFQKMGYDLTVV